MLVKDFIWGFLRGLVLFFLKNNFSEIFIFAILLLCTLLNWVRYTIRLGPVYYSTGVLYTIQLKLLLLLLVLNRQSAHHPPLEHYHETTKVRYTIQLESGTLFARVWGIDLFIDS